MRTVQRRALIFVLYAFAALSATALAQTAPVNGGSRGTNQQAANTGAGKTRSPASLIQPDPLGWLLAPVDRRQAWLDQHAHLALKASYTFLEQYAVSTPETRHNEVDGRLDFQSVWTVHQRENGAARQPDQTTLNLLLRSETGIGYSQQWDLSDSLGSGLGINSIQGGGAERPLLINLLYLKQTWDAQKIALYVGKLHPNQHIGLSPVNDDETSQFLAGPFDGDAAQNALGTYAPGVAIEVGPPNGWYAHALAIDAKAHPWAGTQTLFDGRYYEGLEGGWKHGTEGEGGRDIRAAVYHQNPPNLGHGHGVGVGGDWEFAHHWMPFGRVGLDTRTGTSIKQVDTIGLAHVLPFGRKGDMFGAASTWTRASTPWGSPGRADRSFLPTQSSGFARTLARPGVAPSPNAIGKIEPERSSRSEAEGDLLGSGRKRRPQRDAPALGKLAVYGDPHQSLARSPGKVRAGDRA